ncbi:hypothetical protein NW249_24015 [Streptomyces sp. OUCMDZ-4982]|uniref:hypothetical protein n=1 Tax=Streptomyces sp. OUCMDZ-4982 TaxID=2973090 RepID=UPI00215C5507|nr:hypothetical protein [Streptomyces sp. OUCMDZ-4982]MCR8945187.1 hypothetical protein [Streptomyces sp. OUCMDZ-4982]
MTTPAPAPPPGEPFSEALSEAAQAAAMSVRLILTIADAVRRAAQKHHHGQEKELGPDAEKLAEGWSAEQLRTVVPEGALHDLMAGADWPAMARQLAGLQQAGVDLGTFLPRMGRMAAGVHQAVTENIARTKAEGTDRWADLLRRTLPEGLVRDAILSSPAWPDIAAKMSRLDDQGVDVARILADAHAAGTGVDQAVAAVTTAAAPAPAAKPAPAPSPAPAAVTTTAAAAPAPAAKPAPAPSPAPAAVTTTAAAAPAPAAVRPGPAPAQPPAASTDAKRSRGPLTEGLTDLPLDLDLGNRPRALQQLKINETAHSYFVTQVHQYLPQQEAALLVNARQWPLLAARMRDLDRDGVPIGKHLARLAADDAPWRHATPSETTTGLLLATHHVLTTPLDQPLPTGPRVSATAARSRSTTTPTAPTAPTGTQTTPGPAVPAHRQQTAPAPRRGRGQ